MDIKGEPHNNKKNKKNSSNLEENVKVKNYNKIKNNNIDTSDSDDIDEKSGNIKIKHIFQNTDNQIKGEYNIVDNKKREKGI